MACRSYRPHRDGTTLTERPNAGLHLRIRRLVRRYRIASDRQPVRAKSSARLRAQVPHHRYRRYGNRKPVHALASVAAVRAAVATFALCIRSQGHLRIKRKAASCSGCFEPWEGLGDVRWRSGAYQRLANAPSSRLSEFLAYADQFYQTFYEAPTFHPSI
jgi:hypothetical protein